VAALLRAAAGLLVLGAAIGVQAATLKIATLSPDGSVWMKLLREGAEEVSGRTEGRVKFKFYPGGVMGDDKAVLRKIRLGQLHGAVLTAGGLTQTYTDIQLYNLPLLFESTEEVDYVRSRLDPQLLAGLEEQGFVSFGLAEVGFAYAMSRTPVTGVDEVQALKVWVPDGDLGAARAVASFGITPIPLSIADVLSGLQTGLINGVAVPPVAAIALQWHTQLEHVLDLPLLYVYGLLAMDDGAFGRLSAADQAVIREVMGQVVARVNARNRADHESAAAALRDQGLQWNEPTAAQVTEWQAYAQTATRQLLVEGFVSEDLYQALLDHLQNFRSRD
jgi:TRAP-type C4-dicarboxylate transport system substrate-binding protein